MEEQQLQRLNALTAMLVLLEILWLSSALLWAAEGIISKVQDSAGTYCHLKFPAITEATLFSDRPVLKDPAGATFEISSGRYDYDPLGPEEIRRQRFDHQRERRQRHGSD